MFGLRRLSQWDTAKLCGADNGRGHNMTTSSGKPFFVFDPQPDDIRIEDIAAHLARLCRFNGALRDGTDMYSVAQHCCHVSDHCPEGYKLEGLLHDAHEAYVGDQIKPLKIGMGKAWDRIEGRVEHAVRMKFGLPRQISPEVKHQDYLAVATERRDVLPANISVDWGELPDPWPERLWSWPIPYARYEFLFRFQQLTAKREMGQLA